MTLGAGLNSPVGSIVVNLLERLFQEVLNFFEKPHQRVDTTSVNFRLFSSSSDDDESGASIMIVLIS